MVNLKFEERTVRWFRRKQVYQRIGKETIMTKILKIQRQRLSGTALFIIELESLDHRYVVAPDSI